MRPPKLNENQIKEIRELYKNGLSSTKLGVEFNVCPTTILYQLGTLTRKPTLKPLTNNPNIRIEPRIHQPLKPAIERTRAEIKFKELYGRYPSKRELAQYLKNKGTSEAGEKKVGSKWARV